MSVVEVRILGQQVRPWRPRQRERIEWLSSCNSARVSVAPRAARLAAFRQRPPPAERGFCAFSPQCDSFVGEVLATIDFSASSMMGAALFEGCTVLSQSPEQPRREWPRTRGFGSRSDGHRGSRRFKARKAEFLLRRPCLVLTPARTLHITVRPTPVCPLARTSLTHLQ